MGIMILDSACREIILSGWGEAVEENAPNSIFAGTNSGTISDPVKSIKVEVVGEGQKETMGSGESTHITYSGVTMDSSSATFSSVFTVNGETEGATVAGGGTGRETWIVGTISCGAFVGSEV
jgi:hypothetical protein